MGSIPAGGTANSLYFLVNNVRIFTMSTYTDEDFKELKDIVMENNSILRKLRRKANLAATFTIIRWLIIIGLAIGAFALLQPVWNSFWQTYNSVAEGISTINEAKDSVTGISIQEVLEAIKNK